MAEMKRGRKKAKKVAQKRLENCLFCVFSRLIAAENL